MDRLLALETEDLMPPAPSLMLDDVKSWIWLQKAIHPDIDYDGGCFQKGWVSRKISPSWKSLSIKKWIKEAKQEKKEQERLERAEVHAAISVAGVAAALAALAAENARSNQETTSKENAIAAAAALVAAQCAQMAEAAGAKQDQLAAAMNAATATTDANGILTLTAAASTSLRGAATLRGRLGRKESANRDRPIFSTEESDFSLRKSRALLAKGSEIIVTTPDGKSRIRLVSIILDKDGKVTLRIKKIHKIPAFGSTEECIIHDLRGDEDEDIVQEVEADNSIVITTSRGEVSLKITDVNCYRIWKKTINHMLMLSTSFVNI